MKQYAFVITNGTHLGVIIAITKAETLDEATKRFISVYGSKYQGNHMLTLKMERDIQVI